MSWEKNLSQYNQIGNAVCPLVAEAIGKKIVSEIVPVGNKKFLSVTKPLHINANFNDVNEIDFRTRNRTILVKILKSFIKVHPDFVLQKFEAKAIPLEAIPLAILIATSKNCIICSVKNLPNGIHFNSIPFLIGKDDTASLLATENDHGLDYHLRALLGFDYQIGHFVGGILADLNYGELGVLVNPRTGRFVRGINKVFCPDWLEKYRNLLDFSL